MESQAWAARQVPKEELPGALQRQSLSSTAGLPWAAAPQALDNMARVLQDPPNAEQLPGVSSRHDLATYHHVTRAPRVREPREFWHVPCNAAGKMTTREAGRARREGWPPHHELPHQWLVLPPLHPGDTSNPHPHPAASSWRTWWGEER